MKKYIVITIIIAAGMLSGLSALAATSVTLTPATVSVKAGQTFTVTVTVDPHGVKNYTVELKLNFPADLLQVQSFPFNDQWMALSQAGYYLTDNKNGLLIRTAGYPKGFDSATRFGTITFQAKKAGSGIITLVGGTMALDGSNQNVFAGLSQVNVSIGAPVINEFPNTTVAPTQLNESPVISESTAPTSQIPTSAQQATILGSIGNVLNLGTGNIFVMFLVIFAVAFIVYRLIKRMLKNK